VIWKVLKSFWKKEFAYEYFLFVQLVGGGLNCLLVAAVLHQIDALYIPLVLCEGYGIWCVLHFLYNKKQMLAKVSGIVILAIFLINLVLFQKDYYTSYRTLTDAYFANGVEQCVDYALHQCEETGLSTITVEKGAQWPRLLLHTETLPSEYLNSVVYDVAPAPASFESKGIHINTRINYEQINPESIYIIYFTDVPTFEKDFELTQFYDWYVAVPKNS